MSTAVVSPDARVLEAVDASRLPRDQLGGSEAHPADTGEPVDRWPHTTRVLPWMVAAFLAMVWLVPFDSIIAPFSLGVDSKLDRIVLVLMVGVWITFFVAGGPHAPRLRRSPLNVAFLALVLVALASIAIRLPILTNLGVLKLAEKQVALLLAFVTFFFFVVTAVRPNEVRSFLKFMVILASVSALGTIWEYRSHSNLFYSWAHTIFKGFTVGQPPAGSRFGRVPVVGPTQTSLVNATMLAIALPFALTFVFQARDRRAKIFSYIALGVIIAAAVSTLRKSAVLAPAGALATMALYAPRRMYRALPSLLACIAAVYVISPHAISAVRYQFTHLNDASTQGRTSDYAAVTPDVLAHPLFGRGYGSYDPHIYRILDNQYLDLLITTGFIGLAAFVFVLGTGAVMAHRTIRSRDPIQAPLAVALMATIVAYGIVCGTFDVLAFPQASYLLVFVLALAVVASDRTSSRAFRLPAGVRAP